MAKKKARKKVSSTQEKRATMPVRLDLPLIDYERLERCARKRGLSRASYARQAVMDWMNRDDPQREEK